MLTLTAAPPWRAAAASALLVCAACGVDERTPRPRPDGAAAAGAVTTSPAPRSAAQRLLAALEEDDLDLALELVPAVAAERGDDPLRDADTLERVAQALFDAGDGTAGSLAAVQRLLETALARRRAAPGCPSEVVADTLSHVATIAHHRGDLASAERYETEALAIHRRREGGAAGVATSLWGLGVIRYGRHRYEEARRALVEAIALLESEEPTPTLDLAMARGDLAEVLRALDRYDEAEALMRDVLETLDHSVEEGDLAADDPARLVVLESLAGLLRDEGRIDEAVAALERSRRLGAGSADLSGGDRATSALNLAELYRLQRRSTEAGDLYRQALEEARHFFGTGAPEVATFTNQYAVFLTDQRRDDEAETLFRETLAILGEAGTTGTDPTAARAHHDLGRLLRRQGRDEAAEAALLTALEQRQELLGPRHSEVAATLVELAALRNGRAPKDDDEVLGLLARALEILDAGTVSPTVGAEAMALRAEILWRRGERRAAMEELAAALEIVEDQRHRRGSEASALHFFDAWTARFERLVSWHVEQGDLVSAFEVAERRQARIYLDRLNTAGIDLRASIPADLLAPLERRERRALARLADRQARLARLRRAAAASSEVASLERQLDASARELQQVEGEMRAASPLWRRLVVEGGAPVSLGTFQRRHVPTDSLVLHFQIGRDESRVLAIPPTPGAARAYPLAVPAPDAALLGVESGALTAAALSTALAGSEEHPGVLTRLRLSRLDVVSPEPLVRRLAALYRLLLPAPLRRQVAQVDSVVVIPDGALHLLPLAVLVVEESTGSGEPVFWLDRGPVITYAPSASVFANLSTHSAGLRGAPHLVVVADPQFEPGDAGGPAATTGRPTVLRPLDGTRREGDLLVELAPRLGLRVTHLHGAGATERAVRRELQGRPRYLHLATHGLVDGGRAEILAGLALSRPEETTPPSTDDGLLQMFELNEIGLDSELAVLSACDTQFGPTVAGEGSLTLARGFLTGGARRVVASLWPVDDGATVELMRGFYAELAEQGGHDGPARHARALWSAMTAVKASGDTWTAPYYWGPFVLTGAP